MVCKHWHYLYLKIDSKASKAQKASIRNDLMEWFNLIVHKYERKQSNKDAQETRVNTSELVFHNMKQINYFFTANQEFPSILCSCFALCQVLAEHMDICYNWGPLHVQPGSCLIFKSRFPEEVSQYIKKKKLNPDVFRG